MKVFHNCLSASQPRLRLIILASDGGRNGDQGGLISHAGRFAPRMRPNGRGLGWPQSGVEERGVSRSVRNRSGIAVESFNVLERWKKLQDTGEWRIGAPTQRAGLGIVSSSSHRRPCEKATQRTVEAAVPFFRVPFERPRFLCELVPSRPWAPPSAALIGVWGCEQTAEGVGSVTGSCSHR